MNTRDTIKAVFELKDIRPVPYWLHGLAGWETGLAIRLDEYYGSRDWRKMIQDPITGTHVGFINEKPQNGFVRDTFGTVLQEGNITHVVDAVLPEPSLKNYCWPHPKDMVNWDELKKYVLGLPDKFHIWGIAMGLFERSWFMRGIENILVDMIEEQEFVEELLDGIADVHMRFIDMMVENIPIDAFFGGDDMCDQRGVIMGAERWRKFFKPRLARIIAHCHKHGVPYVMHSCGNVLPLIEDLMEIGLDALESLQPEAMNVYELKRRTRGRLVLIGGMGVQSMLAFGSPEQIRNETKHLMEELGDGGGYIISPSKVLDKEPVENAAAFIETVCGR